MLTSKSAAEKAVAKKELAANKKSADGAGAIATTKGAGKVAKTTTKKPSGCTYVTHTKPPPITVSLPALYRGCKIYNCPDAWRVMPRPGESKYDKRFGYTKINKKEVWAKMLAWCKNPVIPSTSPNYVE